MSEDRRGVSEEQSQNPQDQMNRELLEDLRKERRLGGVPGAGPKGSAMVAYDELPDDPEALKHQYLELQRNLQDTEAKRYQDLERHERQRFFGGEGEDSTLQNLLSHFWNRGLELIFIGGAIITVTALIRPDIGSPLVVGVLTAVAFWERFLRPLLAILWERWDP